jgi:hypothetical protein
MDETRKEERGEGGARRIDGAAKAAFLAAVRDGERLEEAAAAAGFTLDGLYGARRRDAVFRLGWTHALELVALERRAIADAAEHAAGDDADGDAMTCAPNNRRRLQRRRMPHARFTGKRKQIFLAHFAGTADVTAAARAAGVCESTVYKHRQRDPAFRAAFQEALEEGYARLDIDALRQRLAAQAALKAGVIPQGEIAQEFERVLKLLQRWDRLGGKIGPRQVAHGRRRAWTFEQSIEELDRYLAALGIRILTEVEIAERMKARRDGESGGTPA